MSALLALSGFVVQFVGLGAMHWSATVTVVSVSIFMTIVRAVVRRGLANDPRCISIPEKIELVWVALRVTRGDWDKIEAATSNSNPLLTPSGLPDCEWGVLTGFIEPRLSDGTSICDTEQDAKQNTNQNANQDEKQDVKQDVNQGATWRRTPSLTRSRALTLTQMLWSSIVGSQMLPVICDSSMIFPTKNLS